MTTNPSGNSHAPSTPDRADDAGHYTPTRTLILGHRGSPRAATENTLAAFDRAVREGADGVELDVRRTRDGQAAVIHDGSLERTMGCRGEISGLEMPAIDRMTNAKVPRFEQTAAWAAAASVWLNVEFKSAGIESHVCDLIRKMDLGPRTVLSSFDSEIVGELRRGAPDLRTFLLTERWDRKSREALAHTGAQGVCLRLDAASDSTLETLRGEGLPVVVWTVNEREEVRRLLDAGVFAIISDLPAMAVAERQARAAG